MDNLTFLFILLAALAGLLCICFICMKCINTKPQDYVDIPDPIISTYQLTINNNPEISHAIIIDN